MGHHGIGEQPAPLFRDRKTSISRRESFSGVPAVPLVLHTLSVPESSPRGRQRSFRQGRPSFPAASKYVWVTATTVDGRYSPSKPGPAPSACFAL